MCCRAGHFYDKFHALNKMLLSINVYDLKILTILTISTLSILNDI